MASAVASGAELVGLRHQVREDNLRLGRLIETPAAHWPQLAGDLNLVMQVDETDPSPGDP